MCVLYVCFCVFVCCYALNGEKKCGYISFNLYMIFFISFYTSRFHFFVILFVCLNFHFSNLLHFLHFFLHFSSFFSVLFLKRKIIIIIILLKFNLLKLMGGEGWPLCILCIKLRQTKKHVFVWKKENKNQ